MGSLKERLDWIEIPQLDVMRSDPDSLLCWKLCDLLDAQCIRDWHLYEIAEQKIRKCDAEVVGSPHPSHSVKKLLEIGLIRPADLPLLGYLPIGVLSVEKEGDITKVSLLYGAKLPLSVRGSNIVYVGNTPFWVQ